MCRGNMFSVCYCLTCPLFLPACIAKVGHGGKGQRRRISGKLKRAKERKEKEKVEEFKYCVKCDVRRSKTLDNITKLHGNN